MHLARRWLRRAGLLFSGIMLATACSTAYYATWESLGKEKRDLLRDNISAVKDEQAQAQKQFTDALTRLKALTNFQGGELESMYEKIKEDYEDSKDRADSINARIRKVDTIANDLFTEWQDEAKQIANPNFKSDSERKLRQTRDRYGELNKAMQQASRRMEPVLTKLRDHMLYLKHNLNAQAIAGLKVEHKAIEKDVDVLIRDMQISIEKAGAFLATLEQRS